MTIYLITGNLNKLEEARKIIPELEHINLDLDEIQSLDSHEIIKHKVAEALRRKPDLKDKQFLIEDTSFIVDDWNGLPGPLVKWFIESVGVAGIAKLAGEGAQATAKAIYGLYESGEISSFEGIVRGTITSPRGSTRFQWDQIFIPNGSTKTWAEFTIEEKNEYSHRSIALRKVKAHIAKEQPI
jgi:non-canonical purine NTP pyrophosphatase (RdgB/HAM1 family)